MSISVKTYFKNYTFQCDVWEEAKKVNLSALSCDGNIKSMHLVYGKVDNWWTLEKLLLPYYLDKSKLE